MREHSNRQHLVIKRVGIITVIYIATMCAWTGFYIGQFGNDLCPSPNEQNQQGGPTKYLSSDPQTSRDSNLGAKTGVTPGPFMTDENAEQPKNNKSCSDYWTPIRRFFDFKISDVLLIFFTAILAFKTAGLDRATRGLQRLGIRQGRDTKKSLELTAISADAAKRSADAFHIAERPYIFIWGMTGTIPFYQFTESRTAEITEPPRITQSDEAVFYYTVSNRGKLTAIVEKVSIGCGHERNGHYPTMFIIGDHFFVGAPLISVEENVENITYSIQLQRLNLPRPVPELQDGLIFRVLIAYRGPFTKRHETSQCWRYNSSLRGFAEVTDENYTYIR